MYEQIQIKKLKPSRRNLIGWSPSRRGFIPAALALALAWIVVSPTARAVTPAPDGGYPNQNTAEGEDALLSLGGGVGNTAIGFQALFSNTGGFYNTASGAFALFSNFSGSNNTANGVGALFNNRTGSSNTADGYGALSENTDGIWNTASGFDALYNNTTGNYNTANGVWALTQNTYGENNTASGFDALYNNTTGLNNAATGADALHSNTSGNYNTADGQGALYSNTTGRNNTASGQNALRKNTTGSFNMALGDNAGFNLTTGDHNIEIGNKGVAGEAKTIRIGTKGTNTNTYVVGINGVAVAGGVGVIVDTNGHLGTVVSSARFKEAIKPMDKASDGILSLQPVTFRYKHDLDPQGIPQFGLVAEQVAKVNPDLVARDDQGKPYTVRYEAVNAMLLNEFLKEHRKVEELERKGRKQDATIAQQQKDFQKAIQALTATLKEQASQIQKVSDQLAASPAPAMVVNNP